GPQPMVPTGPPPVSPQVPPQAGAAPLPPSAAGPLAPVAAGPLNELDIAYLKAKNLLIPLPGVPASALRDTFYDQRSEGRVHQALDITAPEGTPVLATAGGSIARLYVSARGGNMIYVADPSGLFVYYYAHLQRYAEGMQDGLQVERGQVIAY